jgi:protein TonB
MRHDRQSLKFFHWLTVSLGLHLGIVAPFLVAGIHATSRKDQEKLIIELFGMIANRQQEEKKGGDGALPQAAMLLPKARRQPAKKAAPKPDPDPNKKLEKEAPDPGGTAAKPSSDMLSVPDAAMHGETGDGNSDQLESDGLSVQGSAVFIPAVSGTGEGIRQEQLSIGTGTQDIDVTKAYLARLSRRLQAHLVYPGEVRKHGVEGVSWIRFVIMESGGIKVNSLQLHKSSGFAALDANAIKSAVASAPFEKPPKELKVVIAVSFEVETVRR